MRSRSEGKRGNMSTKNTALFWLAIGGGIALLYYLAKKEVTAAANAINPLNPGNVFNTATTDLYQTVTGSQGSIGTDLYNILNPGQAPAVPNATYFVYDANGNLEYDSNGNLKLSSYPPGTLQNPNPNPHLTG